MIHPPLDIDDFRILVSYHYYQSIDLDRAFAKYFGGWMPKVFADSGAYSAFTQGVEVDIQDYIAWLKRWQHLFAVYANLDVIGNAEGTLRNQKTMEDAGLTPLPAYHTGENWSYLEYYLENYDYIGLGGATPYATQRVLGRWLTECFRRADGRAKYHGFGTTSTHIVKAFPWHSVDSTTWVASVRYGRVPVYNDYKRDLVVIDQGDKKTWRKYASLVNDLGFDWRVFAYRRCTYAEVCQLAALSYMLFERSAREIHGTGLQIYLANSVFLHYQRVKEYFDVQHLRRADS